MSKSPTRKANPAGNANSRFRMQRVYFIFAILLYFSNGLFAKAPLEYYYYQQRLQEIKQMPQSKLVFLGDSLTQRHDWSTFNASNMGIDGDTTEGVLARLHLIHGAEKIVLMIGVNDILTQVPLMKTEDNYRKILLQLSYTPKLYLLSLLPLIDMPQTRQLNEQIRTFNQWLKTEAQEKGLRFIDLYTHFLDAQHIGLRKDLTNDGIHLTSQGYELWEKILADALSGQ